MNRHIGKAPKAVDATMSLIGSRPKQLKQDRYMPYLVKI